MDILKATKLSKLFHCIVSGTVALTAQNNALFLEYITSSVDPASRIHEIINSVNGFQALRKSLTLDTSTSFLNMSAAKLLHVLAAPNVAEVAGGSYVQTIVLECIAQPPTDFWDAFLHAFQAGQLDPNAQKSFGWLLLRLILLPADKAEPYEKMVQELALVSTLADSPHPRVRLIAAKLDHVINYSGSMPRDELFNGPGGRHDNDYADFRQISILPTADELEFTSERAFLRQSSWLDDPAMEKDRFTTHLDNQFRLLREDMVGEMREEVHIALRKKRGKHRGVVIDGLVLKGLYYKRSGNGDKDNQWTQWALTFECKTDFWQFKRCKDSKARQTYLKCNPRFLRHQSLTCLIADGEVVAFPNVVRDEPLLAQSPPILVLRFGNSEADIVKTLARVPRATHVKLIQINTAVFSYEPVLSALQEKTKMPLKEELLFFKDGMPLQQPRHYPETVVDAIQLDPTGDLQDLFGMPEPVRLDEAQTDALVNALSQRVALIQGPPGTGKSFIGALCAKILLSKPGVKILVNCYTNHALDQFLEDLMDIGISKDEVVRIGGKSTPRTAPLSLQVLGRGSGYRLTRWDWREIEELRTERAVSIGALQRAYHDCNIGYKEIMQYLDDQHQEYATAFLVPEFKDGTTLVDANGKAVPVNPYWLLDQWYWGRDAGALKTADNVKASDGIWKMSRPSRLARFDAWTRAVMKKRTATLVEVGQEYNGYVTDLEAMYRKGESSILERRRVIGCTTTGAAMYRELIEAAGPTVLLVEEAGEILESHILTALSSKVEQIILIGDHKQLRPKVHNYNLTVEKGEGFDLNRSLFERLILKGFPHTQLKTQHRMQPEISALVRHLTYPELQDAPSTQGRANIRGLRNNVAFIDHQYPESEAQGDEHRDMRASSKQNRFEVQMVLKIVRYLSRQGYGTDELVILTPYLGQLRAIMDALKRAEDCDAALSELDSHDLVRAGLMPEPMAVCIKKQIRVATIDNYQGEESDIVVASLTRSNPDHEIGFMCSPERLNVLLSRARNGLVMIGNIQTFTEARRGRELWSRLAEHLKINGNIYDGLPVVCERHPACQSILKTPAEFDKLCPNGGCNLPCGVLLPCNVHRCSLKCHRLPDHSQVVCKSMTAAYCARGHLQLWRCHQKRPITCASFSCRAELLETRQAERVQNEY